MATLQAIAETYGKRYQLVDELRDPDEVAAIPESRYPDPAGADKPEATS